jgi:hypothetical protein
MFEQRFDNKHHLVKNRKKQTAKAINLSQKAAKDEARYLRKKNESNSKEELRFQLS